ncbi:DUF4365 domain-containing protein [Niallia taxi]|uniref:DUF4365 domain-containing protein n=1 Tax=Niallia taxi TaxID=2499688 RepID=UPI003D29B7B9
MRLPQRTQALETGNVAVDALSSTLNRFANVIPIPNEKDLGIDLTCELFKSNFLTGVNFFVQCKGTEEAENNKKYLSIEFNF